MASERAEVFWQSYLKLEQEFLKLSDYVYMTDARTVVQNEERASLPYDGQLETFSPAIADLLVSCAVQIEAVAKELYFELGGPKKRGDASLKFDADCLRLIDQKWQTSRKTVRLDSPIFHFTQQKHQKLRPLNNASKGAAYWCKAYQAVKHDRYENLHRGSIWAFLQALAALYLLNIYLRRATWTKRLPEISQMSWSGGSKLFSVLPPKVETLWYGNKSEESDSPYVVRFRDEDYAKIKKVREEEYQALREYIDKEEEVLGEEVAQTLREHLDNESTTVFFRVFPAVAKARLKEKLSLGKTVEDQRSVLLETDEWKSYQRNKRQDLEALLSGKSLEQLVDEVGQFVGDQTRKKVMPGAWTVIATNQSCCEIRIPDVSKTDEGQAKT